MRFLKSISISAWAGILFAVFLLCYYFVIEPNLAPPEGIYNSTAERNKSREAARKEAEAKADQERERTVMLCKFKSVCRDFQDAAKNCAVAANIDRCIDIKLEGADHRWCRSDGSIEVDPQVVPGSLQCLVSKVASVLN